MIRINESKRTIYIQQQDIVSVEVTHRPAQMCDLTITYKKAGEFEVSSLENITSELANQFTECIVKPRKDYFRGLLDALFNRHE